VLEMTTALESKARSHSSPWPWVGTAVLHALMMLRAWPERVRERRRLLSLSDRALRDIGKSREDVAPSLHPAAWIMGEGDQPYWRAKINKICRLPL
jgi:uncharacterized protein YjiS (DUF1127 family)